MNLSHVIASLDARHGGPSKSTRSLAQAQAEQGARVDLFAGSDTPSRETRGQLTTTLLARGWLDRLGVLPGLVTHLRRAEPDLVHVHGLWLRSLGVAHEEAQTRAIPLVVSPRGMMSVWSWQHHRWRKHLAEHWLHPGAFSAAAGWHATSVEEAEEIRSHGFEQPVCVAPHGVDVPDAAALAEARRHWTQACPECARRPTALFYSRFHAKKRVLELIDLWLAQSPPEWLLLLVGVPEQYSVEALRSYVYRAGGSRRIEVFDGMNRPAPYAAASISLPTAASVNFSCAIRLSSAVWRPRAGAPPGGM